MQLRTKWIGVLLCLLYLLPSAEAQSGDRQRVLERMRSLSDRYRKFKTLSFDISYTLASEEEPAHTLDSAKGRFRISGDRYWYAMDSTEFIGSKDISVILFKEDQLMYLARPSSALGSADPLALLDSLLLKNDSVGCLLDDAGPEERITISFRPGQKTKKIEFYIDRSSGLMTRMVNTIESRQLYDPAVRAQVEASPSYARVETKFLHYREGGFDVSDLDPGRYFKKEGSEVHCRAPYESYKIFLGTPDL